MRARLILEDGSVYEGRLIGCEGEACGEVVFNTGMTGYQEIITDPSYRGQIVTLTYPLIGNYGVNEADSESGGPQARGLVVRELCPSPSNHRATGTLESFLSKNGITGIEGVDTRALTRRLREKGTMKGIITTRDDSLEEILKRVAKIPDISSVNLVDEVTCGATTFYKAENERHRVVMIDLGAKANILRMLLAKGCSVWVVSARANFREIEELSPEGIVLTNGPGDPKQVPHTVEVVKRLIGTYPVFGICLGHQVLGLAFGADTFKLKFGHRGANHPVKDLDTGKVYITSQNHGFAVAEAALPGDVRVTHRNLNDGTVEGIASAGYRAFSVQYHPEASPGPGDSEYLFDRFIEMLE